MKKNDEEGNEKKQLPKILNLEKLEQMARE